MITHLGCGVTRFPKVLRVCVFVCLRERGLGATDVNGKAGAGMNLNCVCVCVLALCGKHDINFK